MKFAAAAIAVTSILSSVKAAPLSPNSDDLDIAYLALTLENLESAFYTQGLDQFDEDDFKKAGMPSWARGRFTQVEEHEAQHAAWFSELFGNTILPCNYSFPYTDVKSFAVLSQILEGVGVSAYLGAASLLDTTGPIFPVAASIMSVEARHQAWLNSAIDKAQPWSAPEDTPLSPIQAFTLASAFITSCPNTNPEFPTVNPTLTANIQNARPGQTVTYQFDGNSGPYYAVFMYGLETKVVPINSSLKYAKVPSGLAGTYYVVITNDASGVVNDENTVAGPLISVVDFRN